MSLIPTSWRGRAQVPATAPPSIVDIPEEQAVAEAFDVMFQHRIREALAEVDAELRKWGAGYRGAPVSVGYHVDVLLGLRAALVKARVTT